MARCARVCVHRAAVASFDMILKDVSWGTLLLGSLLGAALLHLETYTLSLRFNVHSCVHTRTRTHTQKLWQFVFLGISGIAFESEYSQRQFWLQS
eukprot:3088446-Amphidinium_carterae.1